MDTETFRKKVEEELKTLDREQIVYFAWLCAVRALPYLGVNGNFNFWHKFNRQKNLYAIFYALDVNAAFFNKEININNSIKTAYKIVNDSAFASSSAAHSAWIRDDNSPYDTAYNIIQTIVTAVEVLFQDGFSNDLVTDVVKTTIQNSLSLRSVFLNDLENIRIENKRSLSNNIDFYGHIWCDFLEALKLEECEYWSRLYKNIFDCGFVVDQEALKRRMNVPQEIREQGAAVVANYLEQLEKKGAVRLNESRIIILGEKGAGKTCLAKRLIKANASMTTESDSTAGVDTTVWKLEKGNINVHIWDFAGHTITHAVHRFFLSERCLYIIVYDGRTEDRNRLDYWLNHMKNYGGDSKALILINKRDKHPVEISINNLREKYNIKGLYTFSIQDDRGELKKFREIVADYIRNNPLWDKQLIPSNYYKVKKELEERFIKGDYKKCEEHITKEEFYGIAKKHGVDNIDRLLKDLDALGICRCYPEPEMKEFNTLVLNPEWISHGVYKIINWASEERKHQLTIEEFSKVFENDKIRYPADRHEFFFRLMELYELAYKTDEGRCLIIPHLLKEDRPESLPEFQVGASLMLRYRAEQQLPPNTISRFIVRHSQNIKKEESKYIVWRYGVVLEDGKESTALVREEDRIISVSVKGRFKTEFISTLRKTLNDIFNSYKSDKPELQYRVEHLAKEPGKEPIWLAEEDIQNHFRAGKDSCFASLINQNILLNDIANNYNIYFINNAYINNGLGPMNVDQRIDNSTHNFNFYNCNIELQGNLRYLAGIIKKAGDNKSADELNDAADALEQVEQCKTREEVKKKGVINGLKQVIRNLGDPGSTLYKTISGIGKVVEIVEKIVNGYNGFAKWLS